jgi:hypothetical protein
MRHVHRPNLRLEVVPWLNVLVAAWLLTLLQSNYIIAPGLTYALDPKDHAPFVLPTTTGGNTPGQQVPSRRVDVTLSLQATNTKIEDQKFVLDNGIYDFSELAQALKNHAAKVKKQPGDQPVLRLLAPANTDLETLAQINDLALAAGFGAVQIAERIAPSTMDQPGAATPAPGATGP